MDEICRTTFLVAVKCTSIYLLTCRHLFHCRFIGEESTSENTRLELSDDPTWIIDPIDGTTNFVHRFITTFYMVT